MSPTFAQLVARTAELAGVPASTTRRVLIIFFGVLAEAVWTFGRMRVPGLATFSRRTHKVRVVTAPDGSRTRIPERYVVGARVAKSWRVRD